MQVRFAWPIDTLSIDPNVEQALKQCLLEPFENEAKAIAYWDNADTTLVHIQSRDDAAVYPLMGKLLKQQVAHGLKYIEHSFALPEPYRLTLSVTDDAGNGVFVLVCCLGWLVGIVFFLKWRLRLCIALQYVEGAEHCRVPDFGLFSHA